MGGERTNFLVGKPEEKSPLVGLMLKLLDIELNLNEIGCEDVD
jgi:hypothetical protein